MCQEFGASFSNKEYKINIGTKHSIIRIEKGYFSKRKIT